MDIWVVSLGFLWLLWILLLITFIYKFLHRYVFSFLLSTYLGVKLLNHMISMLYYLRDWHIIFQRDYASLWDFKFLTSLPHLLLCVLSNTLAILVGVIEITFNDMEKVLGVVFSFLEAGFITACTVWSQLYKIQMSTEIRLKKNLPQS